MTTKTPIKKSDYDLQVECEVAAEVLAECLAYFSKRLTAEQKREMVDEDKIKALKYQISEFYKAKMELGLDRPEIVYSALHVWAPLLGKDVA